MEKAEMELKKAQNILEHKTEISSRAPRIWFQSEQDKKRTKNQSRKAFKKEKQ